MAPEPQETHITIYNKDRPQTAPEKEAENKLLNPPKTAISTRYKASEERPRPDANVQIKRPNSDTRPKTATNPRLNPATLETRPKTAPLNHRNSNIPSVDTAKTAHRKSLTASIVDQLFPDASSEDIHAVQISLHEFGIQQESSKTKHSASSLANRKVKPECLYVSDSNGKKLVWTSTVSEGYVPMMELSQRPSSARKTLSPRSRNTASGIETVDSSFLSPSLPEYPQLEAKIAEKVASDAVRARVLRTSTVYRMEKPRTVKRLAGIVKEASNRSSTTATPSAVVEAPKAKVKRYGKITIINNALYQNAIIG